MGQFHREITVERGLTAALKKAHARARKKGKRRREDPTTITVHDMQVGVVAGKPFRVRSSNLQPHPPLGAGWSRLAQERLATRCRDGDGAAKGRVLFGVSETSNGETVTIAALTYHYENGEIQVRDLLVTSDLTDHRAKVSAALCIVIERITKELSKGRRTRFTIEVSRDEASWYKDKLGFRESARAKQRSRVVLCRDANSPALPRPEEAIRR